MVGRVGFAGSAAAAGVSRVGGALTSAAQAGGSAASVIGAGGFGARLRAFAALSRPAPA